MDGIGDDVNQGGVCCVKACSPEIIVGRERCYRSIQRIYHLRSETLGAKRLPCALRNGFTGFLKRFYKSREHCGGQSWVRRGVSGGGDSMNRLKRQCMLEKWPVTWCACACSVCAGVVPD